ncbi:hypothetical protein D5044_25065 [Verminephrobacter eiseniae]|nr:hypothetical protein [Verminephrobacter eiseniae]MCW8224359.1 hypothetical protein [Verminephrobacter eiseniae]
MRAGPVTFRCPVAVFIMVCRLPIPPSGKAHVAERVAGLVHGLRQAAAVAGAGRAHGFHAAPALCCSAHMLA